MAFRGCGFARATTGVRCDPHGQKNRSRYGNPGTCGVKELVSETGCSLESGFDFYADRMVPGPGIIEAGPVLQASEPYIEDRIKRRPDVAITGDLILSVERIGKPARCGITHYGTAGILEVEYIFSPDAWDQPVPFIGKRVTGAQAQNARCIVDRLATVSEAMAMSRCSLNPRQGVCR